ALAYTRPSCGAGTDAFAASPATYGSQTDRAGGAMSELFRKEAVVHATRRLSGAVVLATPLSVRVLGLVFCTIIFAAVLFASLATYSRKATVTGWLVPDQGLIRATVSSAGFIQNVMVKEGERVEKGAPILEIRVATETTGGNVGDKLVAQLRNEAETAREKARIAIERLDGESRQAFERLSRLRIELQQLRNQAAIQQKRIEISKDEVARAE